MRPITKAILTICVISSCATPSNKSVVEIAPVTKHTVNTVIIYTPAQLQTKLETTSVPPFSWAQYVEQQQALWGRCGQWYDTIVAVGGQKEDWPTWSRILWTESRCIPEASNGACVGLTQIYFEVHKVWLAQYGFDKKDLLNPIKNLTFAVALQASTGWSPWAYLNMP